MTAATTPRLGLISPTNTDPFTPDDFVDTMQKLDNRPGILPVANYAALPAGLTSANHGSCFLQLDNGSIWMWVRPGSGAGAYKKINSVGLLASAGQSSSVSTSTTVEADGPTIVTTDYTAAGGRWVFIFFSHYAIGNSAAYGGSRVSLWVDGGLLERNYAYSGAPGIGVSHRLLQVMGPQVPGSTHTVKVSISSISAAGGGTTTAGAVGQLYIWEV